MHVGHAANMPQNTNTPLNSLYLVLAVVLLGMSQDAVAESEHVLVWRVLLVSQLLQTEQRSFPSATVLERYFEDAKYLK